MSKAWLVLVCAVVLALAAGASAASAATRQVATTGTDVGTCIASPCRTIGYAVGQVNAGDTVAVAAGTFNESVTVTKRLALLGSGATIDAAGFDEGVVLSGSGAAGSEVRGFTVEDAGLEGIFADQTSQLTIARNTVVHNDAYGPFSPLCVNQPDDCGEAVHLQSVTDSVVRQNLVQDNVGGILLTDEDGPDRPEHDQRQPRAGQLEGLRDHARLPPLPARDPGRSRCRRRLPEPRRSQHLERERGGRHRRLRRPAGCRRVGKSRRRQHCCEQRVARHRTPQSHPFQNLNGNVVVNNALSSNGPDDDVPGDDGPTGITVFSAVVPIPHTVLAANRISREQYGIFTSNAVKVSGLPSNKFASVAVPISIH
jgi:hypothetical protein